MWVRRGNRRLRYCWGIEINSSSVAVGPNSNLDHDHWHSLQCFTCPSQFDGNSQLRHLHVRGRFNYPFHPGCASAIALPKQSHTALKAILLSFPRKFHINRKTPKGTRVDSQNKSPNHQIGKSYEIDSLVISCCQWLFQESQETRSDLVSLGEARGGTGGKKSHQRSATDLGNCT